MVGLEYPFTMWSLSALIRFTSVGLVDSSKLELGCVQRGFLFAATCSTQDPHASPFAEKKGQQCGYRVSIEQSGSWVHVLLAAAGSIQASCHPLHHILLQCEAWVHSFDLLQLVWSIQASWNLDVCNVVSFSLQHAAHKIRTQAPLQRKKVNSAVTELALSRVGHNYIFIYIYIYFYIHTMYSTFQAAIESQPGYQACGNTSDISGTRCGALECHILRQSSFPLDNHIPI